MRMQAAQGLADYPVGAGVAVGTDDVVVEVVAFVLGAVVGADWVASALLESFCRRSTAPRLLLHTF